MSSFFASFDVSFFSKYEVNRISIVFSVKSESISSLAALEMRGRVDSVA